MRSFSILFCVLVFCQFASAFTVSIPVDIPILPIGIVTGVTSGHEEITRQSLVLLDKYFKSKNINLDNLSPEILTEKEVSFIGASGLTTENAIIRGNYATDLPFNLVEYFNLPNWYHDYKGSWTNNPSVQVLHFLRNIDDGDILVSQRKTCETARANIIKSSVDGLNLWHLGKIRSALFLFGHASHTIQDSFSNAHTKREDDNEDHNLINVCYYGRSRDTRIPTCTHAIADFRDDIWIGNPLDLIKRVIAQFLPSEEFKEDALKSTAVLARSATLRYFYLIMDFLLKSKEEPPDGIGVLSFLISNLFEGRTGVDAIDRGLALDDINVPLVMPHGIMNCSGLNDEDEHAPVRPLNTASQKSRQGHP